MIMFYVEHIKIRHQKKSVITIIIPNYYVYRYKKMKRVQLKSHWRNKLSMSLDFMKLVN
jgi:hypothetical protein